MRAKKKRKREDELEESKAEKIDLFQKFLENSQSCVK